MTDSPARARRRLYYGWVVAGACSLVACITWGVAIFNQGVFAAFWIAEHGWSPAALSGAPALFQLWAGVVGVVVGRVVDRRGPRPVLLAGAVLVCAALWAIAGVTRIWHVYGAFLVLASGFACIHTVTLGKIVARWFRRHRARAMALATLGAGVGGALLVPLNATLIAAHGPAAGCLALGVATLVVLVPVALWVIPDGPETMGLAPDGDLPTARGDGAARDADPDDRPRRLADVMRTPTFWSLALCLGLGMLAQSAFLFHQTPFLEARVGLVHAAALVSLTTVAGIVGRVSLMLAGDRLSTRAWSAIAFTAQGLAFLVLSQAQSPAALAAGSALFGLTMGIVVTLQPLSVAFVYGRASFGTIYGPVYLAIRAGAAAGPLAVGAVLALTGSYSIGWLAVSASLLAALAMLPLAMRRGV